LEEQGFSAIQELVDLTEAARAPTAARCKVVVEAQHISELRLDFYQRFPEIKRRFIWLQVVVVVVMIILKAEPVVEQRVLMEQPTLSTTGDQVEVQHNLRVLALSTQLPHQPGKQLVVSLVKAEPELTTSVLAAVVVGTVAVELNMTQRVAVALVMLEELLQQR
jgi:hypothetical protein